MQAGRRVVGSHRLTRLLQELTHCGLRRALPRIHKPRGQLQGAAAAAAAVLAVSCPSIALPGATGSSPQQQQQAAANRARRRQHLKAIVGKGRAVLLKYRQHRRLALAHDLQADRSEAANQPHGRLQCLGRWWERMCLAAHVLLPHSCGPHTCLGHNGHSVDGAPPRGALSRLPQPLAPLRVLPLHVRGRQVPA